MVRRLSVGGKGFSHAQYMHICVLADQGLLFFEEEMYFRNRWASIYKIIWVFEHITVIASFDLNKYAVQFNCLIA